MAVRTKTGSVERAAGPPAGVEAAEAALAALRDRFPGAIFARYLGLVPSIGPEVFVAPGAALIGDVRLGAESSVWFATALRADLNFIEVGPRSNLQDGVVVHLGDDDPTIIGADVVVGHRAVLHGCRVGDACLIGIGAVVLDGAVIGAGSVIGAGAVVPAGVEIPPRSLVLGTPGKVVRALGEGAEGFHRELAAKYTRLQHNHRRG